VGDLTREDTLNSLSEIKDYFLEINPQAKLVIAANKIDLFQKEPAQE